MTLTTIALQLYGQEHPRHAQAAREQGRKRRRLQHDLSKDTSRAVRVPSASSGPSSTTETAASSCTTTGPALQSAHKHRAKSALAAKDSASQPSKGIFEGQRLVFWRVPLHNVLMRKVCLYSLPTSVIPFRLPMQHTWSCGLYA